MEDNKKYCVSIAKELAAIYDGTATTEDGEPATFWDYFNDALDIDYVVDSNKEYKAVRIMVTCGGPNVYINTLSGQVELYWWNESATAYIPREICDEIDAVFEEYYNC